MIPSKTKAMAFSLRPGKAYRDKVLEIFNWTREPNWMRELSRCYMCCELVPMAELLSEAPADVAEFFIAHSRKHHWQLRQMSPLKPMDIIAVGLNLYMLYDKYADSVQDFCETTELVNTPDMILIHLKGA